MRDLKPYAVFAEVVQVGSMSAAARRLGMTPSAVSQIIGAMERQAGVSLLRRSTRKLSLTEAGERCYPHCLRLCSAGEAAAASLAQSRDAPEGELRISAPLGFGAHVAPALAPVLEEWAQLRLSLIVDDALIDLIDARIDIALRVGSLADSSWVARPLCELEPVLCASPAYLGKHGTPETYADLYRHHWLAARRADAEPDATLALHLVGASGKPAAGQAARIPVRTATTNQIALQQMCEQGMGIAILFYSDARPALERGALVRILPQIKLQPEALSMLTADRDGLPAKVRVALAALSRYFSALPDVPPA
ncbi:LysR family transcriptional regulator [Chitinasiproducens palmae]|uniref:DNA-binding transcriptional regulator, LysR family n=1 Tax=Chitinasiproducens palmae TaxID=1770053 RepID=A0A1H2PUC5_9BURK|nr:LysR family transcriptional regulator [Chitinasiproducens palmae]SDV50760.1 DNA-binding transcriptional regulator, LysR family [Chitinasiproducens palmae]